MKKVIFMGTPDFAVPVFQGLVDAGYEVQAVFTQPDRPRGRSGKPAFSPVKVAALAAGVPVFQPERLKAVENVEHIRALSPEVIVVAAFGQIIPESILSIPKYGCINVHASLLPKYRGAAPIQRAVIDGEEKSGVTIMQMDRGLDTGDILHVKEVPLAPEETGGSLFEKLSRAGAEALLEALGELEKRRLVPVKQPEESPTPYAAMFHREDGLIDWSQDAERIERLVRGLNPWPGAFTFLGGKQLKLWAAQALPQAGARLNIPAQVEDGDVARLKVSAQVEDEDVARLNISAQVEDEDVARLKVSAQVCGGGMQKAPSAADTSGEGQNRLPGTILGTDKTSLYVQTGSGILRLLELQLEGKKRMRCGDFLRGYPVLPGTFLSSERG